MQESASVYVSHVMLSSGSAENIANSIVSDLTDGGFPWTNLMLWDVTVHY